MNLKTEAKDSWEIYRPWDWCKSVVARPCHRFRSWAPFFGVRGSILSGYGPHGPRFIEPECRTNLETSVPLLEFPAERARHQCSKLLVPSSSPATAQAQPSVRRDTNCSPTHSRTLQASLIQQWRRLCRKSKTSKMR